MLGVKVVKAGGSALSPTRSTSENYENPTGFNDRNLIV